MSNGNLFRAYIGAQGTGVTFPDVPVNPRVTFDFLLSFAIDCDMQNTQNTTNGVFNVFWDTARLTPQAVRQIKDQHPNARVMLSIGGDSAKGKEVSFTPAPAEADSWVNNAFASLRDIIDQYGLDGVDINYERFATGKTDARTFSRCIGQLLARLKVHYPPTKMVTSIAPFCDPAVQEYYRLLWTEHGNMIDYVNFQFYGCGPIPDVAQYVNRYNEQLANYRGATVLASFLTGPVQNGKVTPDVALQAARLLRHENKLPGLFIWSADNSFRARNNNGFVHDVEAQQILSGNNYVA